MDQDSFRRLLQTPRPDTSKTPLSANGRGSIVAKPKTIDSSQSAFKPRKVKQASDANYRDRAAERRQGGGNDYAKVEAVLEDFEKQHANADKEEMEEKRKYLGGDSDHSILVKGLDIALFQANKARVAATSADDDDVLEKAFAGEEKINEPAAVPQKRTREDLLRELKEKRGQAQTPNDQPPPNTAVRLFDEAKKAGKFKPIGFKSIADEKPKKKKVKPEVKDGERKKKRKLEQTCGEGPNNTENVALASINEPPAKQARSKVETPTIEPDSIPDDFNIFGDVGEYEGIDLDDEEEAEDRNAEARKSQTTDEVTPIAATQRWIAIDEEDLPTNDHLVPSKSHSPPPQLLAKFRSPIYEAPEDGETVEEAGVRLEPLASSALPSIKDFLEMQVAADAEEKRKKRKEKKKAKGSKLE